MKERLTGAIILVALMVLLVPELLTGPIRPAPRPEAAAGGEAPLRSYTIDLADEARAHPAAAAGSGPAQPAPISDPAPGPTPETASAPPATNAAQPAADSVPARPAPAAVAAPRPAAPASPATAAGAASHAARTPAVVSASAQTSALVVQLGSFASRANAERLAHQVQGAGFAVSVSQGSSGRRLYRVRVGPVRDRAAAAQLAAKLHAAGHDGAIVPQ